MNCGAGLTSSKPNPETPPATVEDIDALLNNIAANSRFSSPSVRASQTPLKERNRNELEAIYRRLTPREAKWFTRLVLKDYGSIVLDPNLVYRCYDRLLPLIVQVHDSFSMSVALLQTIKAGSASGSFVSTQQVVQLVKPKLGIKVGRQPWFKARSIKHCVDMARGNMSCEKKMDGEYCQIHIDLSRGPEKCIQIFSKSGKDSTEDRRRLHGCVGHFSVNGYCCCC
jgi:DNA ligase 4